MSKLQLKKELAEMDKQDIIELILEMYASRKDAKEYFDFFLNPNINLLRKKFETVIAKELARKSRYYSKARISKIKSAISHFKSFNPGKNEVLSLMTTTLLLMAQASNSARLTDTQINSFASFLELTVDYANKEAIVSDLMTFLTSFLGTEFIGKSDLKKAMAAALARKNIAI